MKIALITIIGMLVAYFAFLRPDAKKKEAEVDVLKEEARRTKEALDQKEEQEAKAEAANYRERKRQLEKKKLDKELEIAGGKALAQAEAGEKRSASAANPHSGGSSAEETFQKQSGMLFTITTDRGAGSGFVCEIEGKPVAVTNAHVISGTKQLRFVKPDGKTVEVIPEQLRVAMDRDLVYFPLKTPQNALKVSSGAGFTVGDEIVCLGNSGGASVITVLTGKIIGMGGDTLEVDAGVIQGNSGCPVVKISSGEVVGVVTRAELGEMNWTTQGTRFEETRRFCLKIEGAKWKQVGWIPFATDATLIKSYRDHRKNLESLVTDLANGSLNSAGYDSSSLTVQTAVRSFVESVANPKLSQTDKIKASESFLRRIDFEIRKGPFEALEEMRTKAESMCSLHKEALTKEIAIRETQSSKIQAVIGTAISVSRTGRRSN